MSIIKLLPENLINQIAAGEVVERPASVVKELVENSIDAGADTVVIEIENGGASLIKVTDNGGGMSPDDAVISLQRHATSKIADENDLWNIHSLGFRGEALASISSVSQLSIRSRRRDDISGVEINCDGGTIINKKDVGMSVGTQVSVRSLFFNTPARKKYLKLLNTEFGHISYTVNLIALSYSEISFKLVHNGKIISDFPKVTDMYSRISDIFGMNTAEAMIPIYYGGNDPKISGFIGKPVISRANTKYQQFIVNKRPVRHHLFANTIKHAFHSMLMENRQPVFFINIEIDPKKIDVNVHPRKLEIKFENEQEILKILYSAVKTSLEKNSLTPKAFTESQRYMSDSFPKTRLDSSRGVKNAYGETGFQGKKYPKASQSFIPAQNQVQNAIEFTKSLLGEEREPSRERKFQKEASTGFGEVEFTSKITAITQIENSYIVAKKETGLVLIDQHAAHERVLYEQFSAQFEMQDKKSQQLLLPLSIELPNEDAQCLSDNISIFKDLGFEIEHFGGNTYSINAIPSFLMKEEISSVITGVLDDITDGKIPSKSQGRTEEIINYMACRSAIKFGQGLSLSEMQKLIDDLENLKRPYTCPHGRPTMLSLTFDELEKMFGRK